MKAILKSRQKITDRDILYDFACPEMSAQALPGQFVEVRLTNGTDPYLRRPFSIFDADEHSFRLLVRNVGRGTDSMQTWESGHVTDVIGPLGKGFSLFEQDQNVLIAAGGIGVAPMYFLERKLIESGIKISKLFSPLRDKDMLACFDTTDHLSLYFAENRHSCPIVLNRLLVGDFNRIYACGPVGFLQTVSDLGQEAGVPVQVSLESRMACGIGICLGCVVPMRRRDDKLYLRVCKDGPVFNGNEVLWNDMPT
jgi:dihydroorotate dehydrogenase electron transfer subunit